MFTVSERDALWADYNPLIAGILRRWARSDDREDLRGDLFVRFSDLLDSFDDSRGIPLVAYLTRMLEFFCYSRWRMRRLRARGQVRLVPAHETMFGEDPTRDWDDHLEREAVVARLGPAVAALPPGARRAITMRYLKEMPYAEIAAAMGITEGTVRSQVRVGLNALRRALP